MTSHWKRLLLAALLSCASFAATLAWYKSTERSSAISTETPLAQVSSVDDEVLRRPATRLLWQGVNTGDNLYNGETIRTSARGELRIQFEDGRYIDLEPDSLIVLAKSKGEISLNLMEGSLFVDAKNQDNTGSAPSLVLNSKDGKVDLSGATASLSKSSGDGLDLQVLDGQARIQNKDGSQKEISKGKTSSINNKGLQFDNSNLTLISPLSKRKTYIDTTEEKPVRFQWKGFPPEWLVSVEAGPSRKELKEIAVTSKPGQTMVMANLPLGKFNWRLIAKNPADGKVMGESPLQRSEILAQQAPTALSPTPEQVFKTVPAQQSLTLRWAAAPGSNRTKLEVAKNSTFTQLLTQQVFVTQEEYELKKLSPGETYWRLSALYDGSAKPKMGPPQIFHIGTEPEKKPEPVEIPLAAILWTTPESKQTQLYVAEPALDLSWQPKGREKEIALYRIQIQDAEQPEQTLIKQESTQDKTKTKLPKPGRYLASIEALNNKGEIVGKSDVKTFISQEIPRITNPRFTDDGNLKTNSQGNLDLSWNDVSGASNYQITLYGKDGKELAKKQYRTSKTTLKNLMPGQYSVKLEAFDQYGRSAEKFDSRSVLVPDKSSLKPPTLKRIKVN